MVRQLGDGLLLAEIVTIQRARQAVRRVADRLRRVNTDEAGQTPTEYLMIVGLMAMVIVVVFTVYFWPQVKDAAKQWVEKVKESVLGTKITE